MSLPFRALLPNASFGRVEKLVSDKTWDKGFAIFLRAKQLAFSAFDEKLGDESKEVVAAMNQLILEMGGGMPTTSR